MSKVEPRHKALIGSFVGTSLEWYDFFLYGSAAALIFPHIFFKTGDPVVATLLSLSTFGIAYVVRPLGAVIFGTIGDRVGRRQALMITLVMMGAGTAAVGLVPSYSTIGVAAPILLVLVRLVQGLSAGGEWGGAVLLSIEHAEPNRRGFYGAVVQMASPVGLLLSSGALLLVNQLPSDVFLSWGWRIPFLAGGILAIIGIVIRMKAEESPEFLQVQEKNATSRAPVLATIRKNPGQIIAVAGGYVGLGTVFYVAIVFAPGVQSSAFGLTRGDILVMSTLFAAMLLMVEPVMGLLVDRVGARKVFMGGLIGMLVLIYPWLVLLGTGKFGLSLLGFLVIAIPMGANSAAMALFFAEAFPANVRYSGVSLGYQFGTVIGGSLPPIIAVAIFAESKSLYLVGLYLAVAVVVSVIACALTKKHTAPEMQAEPIGEWQPGGVVS
ncbi:MFS transporter [Amycolatopsis jejuensis]|uniref:MFS transporter n=1 Tax=Amycolatopsis jejuensis TaxID=330084 RepID=UPI0006901166|nr:MFS transporter [Amycolatopsis jejuensis]